MDFYKILGTARHASATEIKAAYRALALKLHPDVTNNDREKAVRFQQISNAYNTLSNEEKRRSYDKTIGMQRVVAPNSSSYRVHTPPPHASSAPRRKQAAAVPLEHFNLEAWNAFHYPDSTTVSQQGVQRKSWMNMKDNPHQSYYARRAQRAGESPDTTKQGPNEGTPPRKKDGESECVVS